MAEFIHLISIGTSVIRNAYYEVKRYEFNSSSPTSKFLKDSSIDYIVETLGYCSDPRKYDDIECSKRLTWGSEAWRLVESLLFYDPFRFSAEINAMNYFIKYSPKECKVKLIDRAILYHTDTYAGKSSAEIIKQFLKSCGIEVWTKEVWGLGVFERLFEGFSNLLNEVYCDIVRHKNIGSTVFLNLTGGLKPELGVFLLAGSLAGASAGYYIHESARSTVFLPVIRLKPAIDEDVLQAALELITSEQLVDPAMLPSYSWIIFIAEAMGLARKRKDGKFEITNKNFLYLANFLKKLVDQPDCNFE